MKKFGEVLRKQLIAHPVLYTLMGGIATVLFWRGVWHTADLLAARDGFIGWLFYEPVSLVISFIFLLLSGLFISFFVGDILLLSGLKQEQRAVQETRREIKEEEAEVSTLQTEISDLKEEIGEIKEIVVHEHDLHHPNDRVTG